MEFSIEQRAGKQVVVVDGKVTEIERLDELPQNVQTAVRVALQDIQHTAPKLKEP